MQAIVQLVWLLWAMFTQIEVSTPNLVFYIVFVVDRAGKRCSTITGLVALQTVQLPFGLR